ncbi:hypothetical protein N7478_013266 [Penicillium angulare]|uniref:uncharacterized protein n=1 Tax=Penicillium angulare TaxID=116970 RepID=UPI0025417B96|nr:uncharacterized protein N7478_013266 [Penicillium angulare]KAJ5257162.1 hypothetical protein N7478_013266 [Penicillium angulare]
MDGKTYTPINENQSWACISADDFVYIELIENIVRAPGEVGIFLEHFHSESAPGQWEFVLPPKVPVEAADTLLKARDTIRNIARAYKVHPTLYPRLSQEHAGTGSHVHISINPKEHEESLNPEWFFAGVLNHIPPILAFTLPQDISYDRIQAGLWSGGEYACWGWENKEAALRRIKDNYFEIKLMDEPLRGGDCSKSPTDMTPLEREALGVKVLLPKTLDESLAALQSDEEIQNSTGKTLVSSYVAVKKTEMEHFRSIADEERKLWQILRY